MNGLGSGSLPLRRIRLTRNTKSAPPGGFRSLLQNRDREGLGLLLFCRRHHVIAPPLMSELGKRGAVQPSPRSRHTAHHRDLTMIP